MSRQASEKIDEDLIAARDFIASDNEGAARDFLDAAFETFEQLSKFPEMGPVADYKHSALKGMRFFVLPPPFNRWLVFCQPTDKGVDVRRVLYGNISWREEPKRFF